MPDTPFNNQDTSEWSDVGVRFKNVRFGVHQSYKDNDGNMPVAMISDWVNENGHERTDQVISIGGGYRAVDGGASVEHTNKKFNNGPNLGFSKNSKGAVLLDSLCATDENVERLLERSEKTGGPRNAAFWEGITFHLQEEEVSWGKVQENGKQKTFKQLRASELFGWDAEFPEGEESDEGPSPSADPNRTAEDFGLTQATFDVLIAAARQADSYEDFVTYCYDLDVISDDAVQAAVDDDTAGIWSLK